ncbi:hypothetical protein [Caballeronia sp. TF1N1]|uniref:hypothetical protein n=1 Tax=Caballeronia sp. TF1N1 TaxID=2878153 RepID=UPI001FD355AD|nr:hypothetical protein [Caballeronia sp. TF1N1]
MTNDPSIPESAFSKLFEKRRTLLRLACLSAAPALSVHALNSQAQGNCPALSTGPRRITDLIGSNGFPQTPTDICMWREMGLTWGRDSVGPGQPNSSSDAMNVSKTSPGFDVDLSSCISRNNQNGVHTLLYLGYTPKWNASVDGDSKSAPKDVSYWQKYVEAAVSKYSAPPYNVKYFQIWNEAAGRLSGGSPQATFWHGSGYNKDRKLSSSYDSAMQDYVDKIHLPAAAIIRKYKGYVVYGGWPDQGGVDSYVKWLEYRSGTYQTRMIDNVDYLDTHYMSVKDLDSLYSRYVQPGTVRGIWQTEIGDRYMIDPHYLPQYFFSFAVWALKRGWDDPNKYVSMIYHWDGYDPFRLTKRGTPRTYNVPGRTLIVLCSTLRGTLSPYTGQVTASDDKSPQALYSDNDLIVLVGSSPGQSTVQLSDGGKLASGGLEASLVDAVTGAVSTAQVEKRQGRQINVSFSTPAALGTGEKKHLSYLVLRRNA